MKIKICADSTCDLSAELIEKYEIAIIPLYIVKDGTSFADGLEISPKDIFDHVRGGRAMLMVRPAALGPPFSKMKPVPG